MIALYFKSRKNFQDKSTWEKEELPKDYTDLARLTIKLNYLNGLLPNE